jgi:hypothetical protein
VLLPSTKLQIDAVAGMLAISQRAAAAHTSKK